MDAGSTSLNQAITGSHYSNSAAWALTDAVDAQDVFSASLAWDTDSSPDAQTASMVSSFSLVEGVSSVAFDWGLETTGMTEMQFSVLFGQGVDFYY